MEEAMEMNINTTTLTGKIVWGSGLKTSQKGTEYATAILVVAQGYKTRDGKTGSRSVTIPLKSFGQRAASLGACVQGDEVVVVGSLDQGRSRGQDGTQDDRNGPILLEVYVQGLKRLSAPTRAVPPNEPSVPETAGGGKSHADDEIPF